MIPQSHHHHNKHPLIKINNTKQHQQQLWCPNAHPKLSDDGFEPHRTEGCSISKVIRRWVQAPPDNNNIHSNFGVLKHIQRGGKKNDTRAATVVWAMTLLMNNPKSLKKLQEEVRNVGNKGKVDEDDLAKLNGTITRFEKLLKNMDEFYLQLIDEHSDPNRPNIMQKDMLNLNGSSASTAVPSSAFLGSSLKKIVNSRLINNNKSASFKVFAAEKEIEETQQTDKDRWKGLAYDISDDQQDITRGKGMVDSLFQAPQDVGTHFAVMSSYEYISTGLRTYNLDNNMDGFYIAPAFMDKLVVHITKNFMTLPNIKVPLILGVWGGKGQGKSFQCELVFAKMGITPIMMSAGELESGNAGEPAKLIRQRYREAADIIKKGKMCALFINDLDAGAGRMGGTTQYTVNNQMVNATLMNIADNPTNVQLPGMYNKEENPRVPIIVTGNDFSTLYAPLIRDGRMEKFYWAPTREDRIGVCIGIFRTDGVSPEEVAKLVDTFPGQSIDFFGALRARVYDDEVRKWIGETGIEGIGKRLVNSRDGPPTFEQPKITIDKLLEYGNMLVQEQENVKRVQLAETYLDSAALGDANRDSISRGEFYGKAAQQVQVPIPEGCTDPGAENFDPTARSDDGSCTYTF